MKPIAFEDAETPSLLTELDTEGRDALEFGVVEMDGEGVVLAYNAWEARLSGLSVERVQGRNFFIDVAPCTNNFMVAQRYWDATSLDVLVEYTFTFRMRPRAVTLRLVREGDHGFLLVKADD